MTCITWALSIATRACARIIVAPLLLLPDASASDLSTVHLPFSRKSYLFTWLKWQIFFTQHHLLSGLGWTTVAIFHFVFSEPSSASAERIFLSWTDHLLENNRIQC